MVQKILHFFITKIVVSIAIIVSLIALTEKLGSLFAEKSMVTQDSKEILIAIVNSGLAVIAYHLIFSAYEKRKISELGTSGFAENAIGGFMLGVILQSLFILTILFTGGYSVTRINHLSAILSPLAFALEAGVVAEIVIIGIVFRLTEEKAGSLNTLIIFILLFAAIHLNARQATALSVAATAAHAGFMLPAAFMYSRNLWLPIFIHFGWDLAEPGIFGAVNPSTSLSRGLLTSHLSGTPLITGGASGPQDSLQSLVLCLVTGTLFLLWAKRKNNWIKPKRWKPRL